jgi:hypothetical protein
MRGYMIETTAGLVAGTFAATERGAKAVFLMNNGVRVLPHHNDTQFAEIWNQLVESNKELQFAAVQVNIEKILGTA